MDQTSAQESYEDKDENKNVNEEEDENGKFPSWLKYRRTIVESTTKVAEAAMADADAKWENAISANTKSVDEADEMWDCVSKAYKNAAVMYLTATKHWSSIRWDYEEAGKCCCDFTEFYYAESMTRQMRRICDDLYDKEMESYAKKPSVHTALQRNAFRIGRMSLEDRLVELGWHKDDEELYNMG